MTDIPDPQHDPRSDDELFCAALTEPDEALALDAVYALQWRGTAEVFERALALCRSQCPQERQLGVDILAQNAVHERQRITACCELLREMISSETIADVIRSIITAFPFLDPEESVSLAIGQADHPSAQVRDGVVHVLMRYTSNGEQPETSARAVDTLIALTRDTDEQVRDWATFALATQTDIDTRELRDALAARLNDSCDDCRAEALCGLAERHDSRMLAPLRRELQSDCIGSLVIEAAVAAASPELLEFLLPLRDWWDVDPELLEQAIAACSAASLPGDN